MKKLLLFAIVLTLSAFEISIEPREAFAQDVVAKDINMSVKSYVKQLDGMTYRIFVAREYHEVEIQVVNVTKEKLEVEKLKLEITRLKKENRNSGI